MTLSKTNHHGTLEGMGHKLIADNNRTLSLTPDTKEEADRLFKDLSDEEKIVLHSTKNFGGTGGLAKIGLVSNGCLMFQVNLINNNN